jgi:hypothetical protein
MRAPRSASLIVSERTRGRDLGADHFARHDKHKTLGRLVRRLRDLGYEVELKQVA